MIVATADNCILVKSVIVSGEYMSGCEFVKRFEVSSGTLFGGQ